MSSEDVLISPIPCPESWRLVELKELTRKIGSGATPKGGQAAYLNARINFALVRSQNVFDREFSETGLAFISDLQAEALKGVWLEDDDILLNITGDGVTFGRACLVPAKVLPACVNQHVSIIRLDKSIASPGYITSYLTHPTIKSYIESFNAGGSRRAITKAHIESFVIPLPPIEIQNEIAHVLGAFDERIALLRETNATLEAIAQALFKSWFVDFDPVLYNSSANAGTQASSLPAEIQALFPSRLVEFPQGLIPEGWEARQLSDVTSYLSRGISPKYVDEGGVCVINQKCIRDFTVDLSKARRHDPSQRKIDGRELVVGDVLVNSTGVGTLGRVAQVLELKETTIVDSHVTVVRAETGLGWLYLGQALMRKQPEIEAMGEGTTGQTELARSKLGLLPIVCPSQAVLKQFDATILPLKQSTAVNQSKIKALSNLRDTLLPRLISGQLRLPEAEAALAEVT